MRRFDPLRAERPLIVYVDIKSPYAFVARGPTRALADALGVAVDWRPFTLDIPSYLGSARLGRSGAVVESRRSASQWSAVRYAYRDARRYAAQQGLVLRGTTKIWDTSLAHIAFMWAKRQGDAALDAWLDRVWPAFWRRELDVESVDVIEGELAAVGIETDGFRDWQAGHGRAEHDAMQAACFDAGIFGVPTYVVDGERYFGREHLPRVAWLLSGRGGPAPDVAYEAPADPPRLPDDVLAARKLTVCVDFRHPEAWLALPPTLALADALGLVLEWQPFEARPVQPPANDSGADRGARHRQLRAELAERDLLRYAAVHDLPITDPYRRPDPTLAALGLLSANAAGPDVGRRYVEAVFRGHWDGSLDLADRPALRTLLGACGAAPEDFDARVDGDGPAALEALQGALAGRGVASVPAYLVGEEVFVGRAHLPWIRALFAAGEDRG